MKRALTLLLLICLLGSVSAPAAHAATAITATFYRGDRVMTTVTVSNGTLTLPDAPDLGNKQFLVWLLERGDTKVLYGAGETCTNISADLTFYALAAEFKTLTGAGVTYTAPTKLRFDGGILLEDYNALAAKMGEEQISFGMLIAPYTAVSSESAFVLGGAIDGLQVTTADALAYHTERWGVFCGYSSEIEDGLLLQKFSARAYISVTHGGKTLTTYATYDPTRHARSAHGVSAAAVEDRASAATERYTNLTGDGCYSPYTTDCLTSLCQRLDKVVYISLTNGVESKYSLDNFTFSVFEPAHYVSPYRLKQVLIDQPAGYDTYVVVAAEGADFNNVTAYFIGGSYRAPDRTNEWKSDGIYIAVRNTTS